MIVQLCRLWPAVRILAASMLRLFRRCRAPFVTGLVMIQVGHFRKFRTMFVVLSLTLSDRFAMLARMSMMRAAPENRMQQHRRHCQNAGYVIEHRGLHRSTIDRFDYTFGRVLRTYPHRHKPDYHLNVKLVKVP